MSDENDIQDEDDLDYEASPAEVSDSGPEPDYDISRREQIRQQLQSDVEAFLASGGKISEVAPNVVADPPKKPQSNYGGQPI